MGVDDGEWVSDCSLGESVIEDDVVPVASNLIAGSANDKGDGLARAFGRWRFLFALTFSLFTRWDDGVGEAATSADCRFTAAAAAMVMLSEVSFRRQLLKLLCQETCID